MGDKEQGNTNMKSVIQQNKTLTINEQFRSLLTYITSVLSSESLTTEESASSNGKRINFIVHRYEHHFQLSFNKF